MISGFDRHHQVGCIFGQKPGPAADIEYVFAWVDLKLGDERLARTKLAIRADLIIAVRQFRTVVRELRVGHGVARIALLVS
jgi:hypothetical protein